VLLIVNRFAGYHTWQMLTGYDTCDPVNRIFSVTLHRFVSSVYALQQWLTDVS